MYGSLHDKLVKLAALAAALLCIYCCHNVVDFKAITNQVIAYVETLDTTVAGVVLAGATAASILVFSTTTPFNLTAGGMLGLVPATLFITLGCVVGAVVAFVIARFLARDWATRKLRESPMLAQLDVAVQHKGITIIVLARLSPVFPFALLSYVLGVTGVSLRDYTLATAAGVAPGVLLYAWIGSSVKALAGGGNDSTVWLSVAASVISIGVISWKAKQILDEATAGAEHQKKSK